MSLLGAPTHAPPEFTKTDKSKRRGGRSVRPQRLLSAGAGAEGGGAAIASGEGLAAGGRPRRGGCATTYGPIQIHVGRLQAVHRNPVRLTAHIHHEKLDPGLKHAERPVVGRSQRTSVSVVAHKNVRSLLQPWQDVGPRQPVRVVGTGAKTLASSRSADRCWLADYGHVAVGRKSPGTRRGCP